MVEVVNNIPNSDMMQVLITDPQQTTVSEEVKEEKQESSHEVIAKSFDIYEKEYEAYEHEK